jgi:glycosyltransferase involved in cell wall biosynthesis
MSGSTSEPTREPTREPMPEPTRDSIHVVHAALNLRASYGGPARSIPALADALAAEGCRVDVVTADNAAAHDPLLLPTDPRVRVTEVPGLFNARGLALWMPRFKRAILAAADGAERTLLHDHGMWRDTNRAMAAAAQARRLPLIASPRGMLEDVARAHRSARKRVAWALWARRDLGVARCLHATSTREAETLAALNLGIPVAMIPNGVTLPAHAEPADIARPERQVLFVGRLVAVKGLTLLVEAWRRAALSGWRLVIAGPDEDGYGAVVARAIADAGVAVSVSLAGPLDEAAKWRALAASDLLMLPSLTESFGGVVAEALGAARPVIATTSTPWAALATERCGWLADATPDALAAALTTACRDTDDAERADMGARGRAWASRALGWAPVARDMHALYRWVLHGGTPPTTIHGG